jgi:hypothetical protein
LVNMTLGATKRLAILTASKRDTGRWGWLKINRRMNMDGALCLVLGPTVGGHFRASRIVEDINAGRPRPHVNISTNRAIH